MTPHAQSRARVIAGNWKMNFGPEEAMTYFQAIERELALAAKKPGVHRVIFPPAYSLERRVQEAARRSAIELGSQNVHWEDQGAYTGELSAATLKEIGIGWALVGHSERRQYFGETDESAAKRLRHAMSRQMNVVYCIGELLAEREAGRTQDVLTKQVLPFLKALQEAQKQEDQKAEQAAPTAMRKLVWCLAYEPVWAIGTGKTATIEQAQDAHRHIRQVAESKLGAKPATELSILYGGSVTAENAQALLAQPDIDGVLVGGTSLKPEAFSKILAML